MTSTCQRPIIRTLDNFQNRILCKIRFGNFLSRFRVPNLERFCEFLASPIYATQLLWMLCSGCAHATAHHLPIHDGLKVEGRSGLQWFRAITSYLRFRAGADWRPVRHSGPCEVDVYRDAVRVMQLAWTTPSLPVRKLDTDEWRRAAEEKRKTLRPTKMLSTKPVRAEVRNA